MGASMPRKGEDERAGADQRWPPQLQHGLAQLVEAELLYQRGILPQATYVFNTTWKVIPEIWGAVIFRIICRVLKIICRLWPV
jgi:hypothetical protein